jgi:OmpA-OmpF porin, OOP family
MSNKVTIVLLIIVSIVLGTMFFVKECNCVGSEKNEIEQKQSAYKDENLTTGLFSISGYEFSFNCNANILFTKSNSTFILPLNECIDNGFNQLKSFLASHNQKIIVVEGFAKNSETNSSSYPTLGLARAEEVKKYLVNKGFEANSIFLNGVSNDDLSSDGTNILNPISIRVDERSTLKIDANKNVNNSPINNATFEDIILMYNTENTIISIDAKQNTQLQNAIQHLKRNLSAKILLQAVDANNSNSFASNRLAIVKDYFVKAGIDGTRIIIQNLISNNYPPNSIIIKTI